MRILGISAYYHDSAAAIVCNGEIIAAAHEERFTRIKHDPAFPSNSIKFCLEYSGCSIDELDAVVFYDKPLLKFERLLETYYEYAPAGITSFISSIPVWFKEKLFLKKLIRIELRKIQNFDRHLLKLLFSEHHLSHAASAYYPSPFNEAAILTIDGVGEWATASICKGHGKNIEVLKEMRFPHSIGMLYSAFTFFLGFKVNSGEYKLMGLAPFGNSASETTRNFIRIIRENLVEIFEDGSIFLNMEHFRYHTGLKMINEKNWQRLFGIKRRIPESDIEQVHCDLAAAIQEVTNEIVLKIARYARKLCNSDNLCLAGGVALNCVSNGIVLKSGLFKSIFIQPAAGDAGGALGAALAVNCMYFKEGMSEPNPAEADRMKGAFLGPEFSNLEIEKVAKKYKAVFEKFADDDSRFSKTAALLSEGNVVGWFQRRMEFGPRALGNRSILADARSQDMQKKLNLKIKFREGFRPFAPSVLEEDVSEYFELHSSSPYMLLVADVVGKMRELLPDDYDELPLMHRLYFKRSKIPAVTHVDFSARIQTVSRSTNPDFWNLICKFREMTSCGVIVNTSFNLRGEPIVCSPEDAYICFMRTEMDFLVLGDYIFDKKLQPHWEEKKNNKNWFEPD